VENITIREMITEDVDQISAIYGGIIQKPVHPDFDRLIEKHANSEEDVCLVAELDGQVVGFIISYILTLGFGIEKSAWIATLGVNPKFMGRDIGRKMANKIFEYYQSLNIENVYTSVRWDSPDLLSFFKTLGFDRSNFINLRRELQ
jgi:ribosomal protein S18 acetylase RimI-like enzyme